MIRNMQYWLPSYISSCVFGLRLREHGGKPVDIILCVADHFEPSIFADDPLVQKKRIEDWISRYPRLADKHRDFNGNRAVHTWFFPPHDDKNNNLESLTTLCKKGYGEIELHLHHDRIPPFPDSAETLKVKIKDAISRYSGLGIFGIDKNNHRVRFGFVHGDWALDNSRCGKYCGVNNELQILSRLGCYADFTFPCLWESQPKKINAIYYAQDDLCSPKSYNTGVDVALGHSVSGDLIIIEGPIGLRPKIKWHLPFVAIEAANISSTDIPTPQRIRFWVNAAIHVKGQPDWTFIKVHTHGAPEANADVLLGEDMDRMYSYLEEKYNDGKNYRLHYVTAREMYNMIKAAEFGERGDPNRFRDYLIAKPPICKGSRI